MERQGDEVHVNTTEARGGSTPHIVRYVLVISLLLAILAMSVIWITGALSSPQGDRAGEVTNQATPLPEATMAPEEAAAVPEAPAGGETPATAETPTKIAPAGAPGAAPASPTPKAT